MIAIIVACPVVLVSTMGLIHFSAEIHAGIGEPNESAIMDTQAAGLADLLLGQPGDGWTVAGTTTCPSSADLSPDKVKRPGFRLDNACGGIQRTLNTLSVEKLAAARSNALDSHPFNNKLDYQEIRELMGMEPTNINFRIDTEPMIEEMDLRILYIADYDLFVEVVVDPDPLPTTPTTLPPLPTTTPSVTITPQVGLQGCIDCEGSGASLPASCFASDWCFRVPDLVQQPRILDRESFLQCVPPEEGCAFPLYVPQFATIKEAHYLKTLRPDFSITERALLDDSEEIPYAADGDILPDVTGSLGIWLRDAITEGELPDDIRTSTSQYNVIVIGSNVNPDALGEWDPGILGAQELAEVWATPADMIEDWVEESGGYLIHVGADQPNLWPAVPFWNNYIETFSPNPMTVTNDPLVTSPYALDYADYDDPWGAWTAADQTRYRDPIPGYLMISHPGVFGSGMAAFTAWRPYNVAQDFGGDCDASAPNTNCEGVKLLGNLLYGIGDNQEFHLGPAIPEGVPSGAVQRVMAQADAGGNRLAAMKVMVTVWHGWQSPLTYHGFPFDVPVTLSDGLNLVQEFRLKAEGGQGEFTLVDYTVLAGTWTIHMDLWPPGSSTAAPAPYDCQWSSNGYPILPPCVQPPAGDAPAGLWTLRITVDGFQLASGDVTIHGDIL